MSEVIIYILTPVVENEEEEPPLREWDGDMKQSIVEVECRGCNTIYKDRQCRNDCVSCYRYEYPQRGFYWKENKECFKCWNLKKYGKK